MACSPSPDLQAAVDQLMVWVDERRKIDLMAIAVAFSFLVHPGKSLTEQPQIAGTKLSLHGRLFDMLNEVYLKSVDDCTIEIAFLPNALGQQQNDCRDLVMAFLQSRTELAGRKLAERLQSVTTHRSGLGLLFLMAGDEGGQSRLVMSRFPADSGILAEQTAKSLNIRFLERLLTDLHQCTDGPSSAYFR